MAVTIFECPSCGGPNHKTSQKCEFCGVGLLFDQKKTKYSKNKNFKFDNKTLWQADFGFTNAYILIVTTSIAALIYAVGWNYEDTQYWLAETAVIIWVALLPLWLAITSFFWKALWGQWIPGIMVGIAIFLTHMLRILLIDGRLNDDGIGISAMFGAASLLGWILGRVVHLWIRNYRAKANFQN